MQVSELGSVDLSNHILMCQFLNTKATLSISYLHKNRYQQSHTKVFDSQLQPKYKQLKYISILSKFQGELLQMHIQYII